MIRVALSEPDSLPEFRKAVRALIGAQVPPDQVTWTMQDSADLFGDIGTETLKPSSKAPALQVPASYQPLAEAVICHRDPERFALLYTLLWRILHNERALLMVASDPLVHRLRLMEKSVRRDRHKMTAFVRFRKIEDADGERYIAWFEPEHHILRLTSSFFVDRFAAMRWSILTPEGSLHWDTRALTIGPAISRDQAPTGDDLEDWWKRYYRATFNPARANVDAMLGEMPRKYWKNMPEAALIPEMLAEARSRTRTMIDATPLAPRQAPGWAPDLAPAPDAGTLEELHAQVNGCRRCPLWKPATQAVFGQGPVDAPVVFVGEQPGDQEDLAGLPFVGPAGQMFDRAMAEAGLDRSRVYVTNAVKHFKYEPRGKRRLHKTPSQSEVEHCRWWVEQEIGLIKPQLVVAMGATAARALTGRAVTISRERGRVMPWSEDRQGLITVHPSYLLRLPDAVARSTEYARFVDDLRMVGATLPEVRAAA